MKFSKEGYLILGSTILFYLFVIVLKLQTPATDIFNFITRFSGLLGLTSIFIAMLKASSPLRVSKAYLKPFTDIHHIFAFLGIILITLHPLAFALSKMDVSVFLPRFDSWQVFWELAGRPALPLIYIATLGGRLRTKIPQYWRIVHSLTYVAFCFGIIHGMLIGTDLQRLSFSLLFAVMLSLVFILFLHKRIQRYKFLKRRKVGQKA